MKRPRARVLVVEDEPSVRDALEIALSEDGYVVVPRPDGTDFMETVEELRPDLAILDVRLPGRDGLALARELRGSSDVPVLFLSAADAEDDRVAGFHAGAEDYVVKPFSMAELLLRVEALLRRAAPVDRDLLAALDLSLDRRGRYATRGGHPIDLTATEFELLEVLVENAGQVVPREDLARAVWGEQGASDNLLEVRIHGLRKKLQRAGPPLVHTVRGVGYVLRPPVS